MKFIKRILPVVLCGCMCLPMAACGDGSKDGSDTVNTSAARAAQLADNVFEKYIDQDLYTLDRNDSDWELFVYDGYSHEYESGEGGASVWHYTAVYALANRMYALYQGTDKGEEYKQLMDDLYEELAWYRGTGTFVEFTGTEERTVYGVNRSNVARDQAGVEGTLNVYDDQMWLLREMLESYDLTGEEKYLEEAEYLANYCLAGWDCSLDEYGNEYGGILWGPGYQSRHTCSNGPIISPLVWLYEVYQDSDETIEYKYQNEKHEVVSETMKKSDYYLMFAKKVYNYTIQYLKKANDLFYDNKGYNVATWEETGVKYTYYTDGKYQPESLTYNSGSPLSGAVDLYRVTGDETYLEQAKKIAAAAYDYFADETFKEDVVRYPTNSITTWFNFVLYRGFYDLYNVWQSETSRKYIDSFRGLIDYAYDNYYRDGFLPRDLAGGWHPGYEYDEVSNVMDAASAAETMALAAQLEIRHEDLVTLDGDLLTSGENGFTFDAQTGTYSLTLDASVTEGTLEVSYDNTGIADPTKQLVESTFSLNSIKDYGNAAWSPTLSQNSDAAQTINVTISIDSTEALLTDDQAEEVTVKLGNDHTFSYAGEGVWKLEGLTMAEAMAAGDLTVTFAEEGTLANIYEAVNEGTLSGSDYANGQANISVSLVERDILPGLTLSEMKNATVLSYDYYQGLWAHNVFRNFTKSEGIRSQEQNEGDTIQTETTRATSETEFNGYIYARKTITDGNKTMIVSMRTHNTSIATRFGVMVVDLTTGARELVGGMLSSTANSYTDQVFDLSAYVGKEVLVSTGIFYTQACDNALPDGEQLQYVIESIRFISAAADWKTDSAENWDATVDTIAGNLLANESVAANSMTYFQGANNDSGNKNYIFKTWGAVSKGQDYAGIEPVGEGAMIKTRNGSTDTSDNRAFLYAKFTITEETSYLWLNARRFSGSNHVGSALTVYTADGGTVVAPDSTNFVMPSGGEYDVESDNWIKWHDGDSGYAYLKWDLSSYIGQTVVLVIGVRNTYNSDEGKMAIQEIHLGSAADGQSAGKVTA